jgi:hypothetical protein
LTGYLDKVFGLSRVLFFGYSAETEFIVLVELLLKESVARFFPSLGFPRIKILVSLVHGVDVILI